MQTKQKPKLSYALRLKCPYCGVTPLRAKGSWFQFAEGCPRCNYKFERELGYYSGASWMVNFPVTATLAVVVGGFFVWFFPNLSGEILAAFTSVIFLAFGVWFTPFSMAIWIYWEHSLHALRHEDRLKES